MRVDLTGAVEAAAKVNVQQESSGLCTLGRVCALCDCFADEDRGVMRDGYARDKARAAIDAAAPLIEAQVREMVAREIEAACYPHLDQSELDPECPACTKAARIARGGK